jgi:hypothetical protein
MAIRRLALITCAAAVLGLAAAAGDASPLTTTNFLTFSGNVGLPGVTLSRGDYVFEVHELNHNIVRVLNRDRSRVYFTGFTRQVARPAGMDATRTVTFAETARGVPPRIEVWYPVGKASGREFMYPDATR